MNISLRADNRPMLNGSEWSYNADNVPAGVLTMTVENASPFSANDFVCVGEVGNEFTELCKIASIAGNVLTFTAVTAFPHSESSKVTFCPFDQVRFYWTAVAVFDATTPLTGELPLTPYFWFTQYLDNLNTTGFAWFVFSNSVTGASVASASPIPYANFARNTVKKALDGFYSLLNSNEVKLVSHDEAVEWLCEAYDEAKNELSMNVDEYDASDGTDSVAVVSGTAEYDLASDFGEMITGGVRSSLDLGFPMEPVAITQVDMANYVGFSYSLRPARAWYIRGNKIGIVPTPDFDFTLYYRYKKQAADLVNYYDVIDLPKKAFNCMKDFMLYRAGIKLKRADYMNFLKVFKAEMADMRLRANNRDGSVDMVKPYRSSNS